MNEVLMVNSLTTIVCFTYLLKLLTEGEFLGTGEAAVAPGECLMPGEQMVTEGECLMLAGEGPPLTCGEDRNC